MDFSQVKSMSIPEGEVVSLTINGKIVWSANGMDAPESNYKTLDIDYSTFASGKQYGNEWREVDALGTVIASGNVEQDGNGDLPFSDGGVAIVSTHNVGCHINTQLRIYDSSSNSGWAIIKLKGVFSSTIRFRIGYKRATLEVYGSTTGADGSWEKIGDIATTTTAYSEYYLYVDGTKGYTYLKLDASGAQLRIANMTITYKEI